MAPWMHPAGWVSVESPPRPQAAWPYACIRRAAVNATPAVVAAGAEYHHAQGRIPCYFEARVRSDRFITSALNFFRSALGIGIMPLSAR